MGWWPFKNENNDNVASENINSVRSATTTGADTTSAPIQVASNYSKGQKILLEDTNPRFNNEVSQRQKAHSQEEASFKRAWDTVKWEDFSLARLSMIPCFREAGLIGFTSMFVVGAVTFLYHKNPVRSANWSVSGLLLGSVVGWEQCRLKRKRSFQVAQMARDTVASKKKPMINTVSHDEKLVKQWEGHTNGERPETKARPWYKLW